MMFVPKTSPLTALLLTGALLPIVLLAPASSLADPPSASGGSTPQAGLPVPPPHGPTPAPTDCRGSTSQGGTWSGLPLKCNGATNFSYSFTDSNGKPIRIELGVKIASASATQLTLISEGMNSGNAAAETQQLNNTLGTSSGQASMANVSSSGASSGNFSFNNVVQVCTLNGYLAMAIPNGSYTFAPSGPGKPPTASNFSMPPRALCH